jgi:hypothetical protein
MLMDATRARFESGQISRHVAESAVGDLSQFPIDRYPHFPLLWRIRELGGDLGAYDAAYLALAEMLETPLLTQNPAYLGVETGTEVVLIPESQVAIQVARLDRATGRTGP